MHAKIDTPITPLKKILVHYLVLLSAFMAKIFGFLVFLANVVKIDTQTQFLGKNVDRAKVLEEKSFEFYKENISL
jgi:hypothetical protein